jgi:redox-sensitive bicupin YhaK (pirin superfamily)
MIQVRKSFERGHYDHGWLDTRHTFSFDAYYNPDFIQFRSLRVLNEDMIAPGQGFGMHAHKDMEILTMVLQGALRHHDNMNNGSVIRPGEVQYMGAGTGVIHGEFNNSETEPVHLYQIWIRPDRLGHKPSYDQRCYDRSATAEGFELLASPDGTGDSVVIHQDARLFIGILPEGIHFERHLEPGRHAWVQVARGIVDLNGIRLEEGDGAALSKESIMRFTGGPHGSEVLYFDLN